MPTTEGMANSVMRRGMDSVPIRVTRADGAVAADAAGPAASRASGADAGADEESGVSVVCDFDSSLDMKGLSRAFYLPILLPTCSTSCTL